ncbi:MAG: SDR family oxidoreductase [Actinomycetota bacterium]|nr:SDR family oxidoreductase [Actinomycetota bacterium]
MNDSNRFSGKVVIVTGAARGLGRDYARYFAADGANVVVADVKDTTGAAEQANAIRSRCIGIECDVTSQPSVNALVGATVQEFGRLDILINNAGLWRGLAEAGLLECPDEVWDLAWAVNVNGTLRATRAAVSAMKTNSWGRVVNVSSMAAKSGGNSYGLTKSTVENMTRGMAREVGDFGITVNCIEPGISAFEAASSQLANADAITGSNPIKRFGTSREQYEAMAYFCSDGAGYTTGQTLYVDGGATS